MMRSAFVALAAAVILVLGLGWQNISSAGLGQWSSIEWDKLAAYLDQEEVAYPGVISDESQIRPLISKMIEAGVTLGNSPYSQTQTDTARLTVANRECVSPKANLNKTAFFLRSSLFEPLDPISVYHDQSAKFSPELTVFFQEYGYGYHTLATNALGERVTLPATQRPRKVIVAGGSVAFGAPLDDANTLASRLQALDSERQYINLAVPDAPAEQVICNLTLAVPRYHGEVDELIYVYSEGDLDPSRKYGTPEDVIAWLKNFAQNESLAKVTVIYAPSIYNIVPQYTRYKGHISDALPNPEGERERLRKIVAGAQFEWLDIGEIMLDAAKVQGNEFAVLNNFADGRNLTVEGMNKLMVKLKGKAALPVAVTDATTATAAAVTPGDAGTTTDVAAAAPPAPQPPSDAVLESRLKKQSAAIEEIRGAMDRAAKNNRLRGELIRILEKLRNELAEEATAQP